jgi:hypothetical protein
MSASLSPASIRPAAYYFAPAFRDLQPRVVLMVGTSWRPNMRAHYGLDRPPIFERAAYRGEPDHFPSSRHPWGWVFKPQNVVEYERASGMPPVEIARLSAAIERELAQLPYETEIQRQIALQALARVARVAIPMTGVPA